MPILATSEGEGGKEVVEARSQNIRPEMPSFVVRWLSSREKSSSQKKKNERSTRLGPGSCSRAQLLAALFEPEETCYVV
jgi:hypothetical protein